MKKYILLFALCTAGKWAMAQSISPSTLNAAGGMGMAGSTEVDWSAAEMTLVSTTPASTSVVVTQGVIQPSRDNTGVAAHPYLADHVQVFPNPASTMLNIRTDFQVQAQFSYTLTDISGKLILQQSLPMAAGQQVQQLSIGQLATGSYVLHLSYKDAATHSEAVYKIQKVK